MGPSSSRTTAPAKGPSVRPENGVVPIQTREIQIDLYSLPVRLVGKLFHNVAFEWRLHDGLGKIAIFYLRSAGSGPVDAIFHPGSGVEHGKAFIVLRGEGEHSHAAFLERGDPVGRVKIGRIPRLVELVVFLAVLKRDLQERPGLRPPRCQME